jgi:putative tryptophan/tyrosine transport system substrate-binding protein
MKTIMRMHMLITTKGKVVLQLILAGMLTLLCFLDTAVAKETKTPQDGETIIVEVANKKGAKRHKIAVLFWHESSNDFMAFEGIKQGFNIARIPCEFKVRQASGDEQKAKSIIVDVKSSPPDLIYAMGTGMTKRLMKEIHDIPIVFTAVTNPVQSGITPNWQTSGRNITGNSNWIETSHILKKFKETVPALKKLGVMYNPDNSVSSMEVAVALKTLNKDNSLAMELITSKVKQKSELESACKSLIDQGVNVIWVPIDILVYKNLAELKKITVPAKIPMFASSHRGIKDGAMLGVVVDYLSLGKKSVILAKKILTNDMAPIDIPIGRMHNYQAIINIEAADLIGYEIPLELLTTVEIFTQ